ncbi:UDP-galactose transporter, putative, partial [Ixodes scapularis]
EHPGCSNLITFSHFLFISVEGFIFSTNFGKRRPVVPLKHYVMLVVMFFLVSIANNNALSYDISMPLHMIFKSDKPGVPSEMGSFYNKCKGIALLTFSLLLSARMGIYQESLASRYGKHPRESLFYAPTRDLDCTPRYVCIRSVYVLTTECSSLTVTLVITLRKFVSLLLSLYYFQNPFTAVHWFGTALVFTGTLVFTEVFPRLRAAVRPPLKAD